MNKMLRVLIALSLFLLSARYAFASDVVHSKAHIAGSDAVKMLIGTLSNKLELLGEVIPIVVQPKEVNPPNVSPYAAFLTKVSPWAMPMTIQKNKKDYVQNNPITAKYCAKLVVKAPWGESPLVYGLTEDTRETVHDYPDSRKLMQGEEVTAAWAGTLKKGINPENGLYDFDRMSRVIFNISTADCAGNDPGTPQPETTVPAKTLASFPYAANQSLPVPETIFVWVEKIIDGIRKLVKDYLYENVPMYVDLFRKSVDGHVTNDWCWLGRCDPSTTIEDDTTKVAEVNGSLTGSLLPMQHLKIPITFHAVEEQVVQLAGLVLPGSKKNTATFQLAYKNANSAMEDAKTAACMLTPLHEQTNLSIGDAAAHIFFNSNCVSPTPTPEAKCPIDIIAANPAPGDASCKLCGTNAYKSLTYLTADEMKALPNGVPPLMEKVLAYVGGLYNVPGSVLLGTMLEEGAFSFAKTDNLIWSDDATVKTYSDCTKNDPMTMCRGIAERTSQGAAGPFGILPNQWDMVDDKYEIVKSDPLWQDVLKARKKETISECNFVDAAFFAAREIGEDASHKYLPELPDVCTDSGVTYPMYTGNARPASCGEWGPDRVATTRYQYGDRAAVCGNGSVYRMENTFSHFTCGK
jgi:hypothetical protein